MGGWNSTETKILNQIINTAVVNTVIENHTSITNYVKQSNKIVSINNRGLVRLTGIKQVNISIINATVMIDLAQNTELMSEVIALIANEIEQEDGFLTFNNTKDVDIENVVKNAFESNFTVENLTNIKNSVEQENLEFNQNNTGIISAKDTLQINESEKIIEVFNNISSEIIANLKTDAGITNEVSQLAASIFGSFGSIFVIIVVVILGGGAFLLNKTEGGLKTLTKPAPMVLIGLILAFTAYVSLSD
jgi:hypothetical protein